jgi:cytochrome c peroxidase
LTPFLRDALTAAACAAACVVALILGAATRAEPDLRALYAGAPETWPRPRLAEGAVFAEFGPLPPVVHPAGNPGTPEKIELGERLFNDPRLSGSGQLACASCHAPELGFGDALKTSFGHDRVRGRRNAQPLFVVGWFDHLFWDGRAGSLEEQALAPLGHPEEMAATPEQIEERLNADPTYVAQFQAVFGPGPITIERVAMALAAFERSLKPRGSKFDRALRDGTQVLTDQELQGLHLFRTKAGCASCHSGPLLSDQRFHNLGLTFYGRELEDLGRFLVTGRNEDVGAFRTPSLRNIRRTGPYMHNGLLPHLEGVVNFYDGGGAQPKPRPDQVGDPRFPVTSPFLESLRMTREEKAAVVAFLDTL